MSERGGQSSTHTQCLCGSVPSTQITTASVACIKTAVRKKHVRAYNKAGQGAVFNALVATFMVCHSGHEGPGAVEDVKCTWGRACLAQSKAKQGSARGNHWQSQGVINACLLGSHEHQHGEATLLTARSCTQPEQPFSFLVCINGHPVIGIGMPLTNSVSMKITHCLAAHTDRDPVAVLCKYPCECPANIAMPCCTTQTLTRSQCFANTLANALQISQCLAAQHRP
eukprot:1161360-Pelagomonas_calceolata.AAC.2